MILTHSERVPEVSNEGTVLAGVGAVNQDECNGALAPKCMPFLSLSPLFLRGSLTVKRRFERRLENG